MGKQFFTYDAYYPLDEFVIQFFCPVLVQPIGDYPIGTTFDLAVIDYEHGDLQFWDDDDKVVATFKLSLVATKESSQ